ncbi:MAG TPA: 2'-5' RNA ligase family protein [Pyrinomonadaceae bacterium]|nr:2'-5' RNA ligase family protein [Pyrinomonadaceae bacterium]
MGEKVKTVGGMEGVVSLLDDEHYASVEGIWRELERDFGVRGVYATPFPHFSYQVAESYPPELTDAALSEAARECRPFKIRTAGLGVFNATHPVLYVAIVRGPELSALHELLWSRLAPAGRGVSDYYSPGEWVPHITLAQSNIDYEQLCSIMRSLGSRSFHWEVTVDNLSLIYDTGERQGMRCRYQFGGGTHLTPEE